MKFKLLILVFFLENLAFAQILPKFEIGDTLPNFSFKSNFKRNYSLSDLKGSYVLVFFWSSWNKESREIQKDMFPIFNKFKDKKFSKGRKFYVVSVSIDDSKKLWEFALKKDNPPWNYHQCDFRGWNSTVVQACRVNAIPFNYLLNSDGVIVGKNMNAQELERLLYGY